MTKLVRRLFLRFLQTATGSSLFYNVTAKLFSLPTDSSIQGAILQGSANNRLIPENLHRIWPYWVYHQFSPRSPYFVSPGIPVALNCTNRNWTTLADKVTVDPRGLITVPKGWSLDFWIANSAHIVSAAQLKSVTQHFDNSIVRTAYETDALSVHSDTFFAPLPPFEGLVCTQVKIKNKSEKQINLSFYFAVRPYNAEGLAPVDEIVYLTSNAFIVNNAPGPVFDRKPDNVVCVKFQDGDVSEHFNDWQMILQAQCPDHQASGFVEYKIALKAGEDASFSCKIPTEINMQLMSLWQKQLTEPQRQELTRKIAEIQQLSYEHLLPQTPQPKSTLSIPDKKLESLYLKNKMHLQNLPKSSKSIDDSPLQGLLSVYPLGSLSADDPGITDSLAKIEKRHMIQGIYFQGAGVVGFHVPWNLILAHIYLMRRDPRVSIIVDWLVAHASPTGCWPDSIHPVSLGGLSGDGHSRVAAELFVDLVEKMAETVYISRNAPTLESQPRNWPTENRQPTSGAVPIGLDAGSGYSIQ